MELTASIMDGVLWTGFVVPTVRSPSRGNLRTVALFKCKSTITGKLREGLVTGPTDFYSFLCWFQSI